MTAPTATLTEAEVTMRQPRDRRERILADPTLDQRVKELYLDPTFLDTAAMAAELGIDQQRIYVLRSHQRSSGRRWPHPSVVPGNSWGTTLGELREWAVQRCTHDMDPDTGKLTQRVVGLSHGRPRGTRITRAKPEPDPRWLTEQADNIRKVQAAKPDWATARKALNVVDVVALGVTDPTDASRTTACLRAMRAEVRRQLAQDKPKAKPRKATRRKAS